MGVSTHTMPVCTPHPIAWQNSLGGCTKDWKNCLYGCCCTCCAFGSARNAYDTSNTCFNMCCVGCVAYNIIREGYNLEGSCCTDCIYPTCCGPCAAVQLLNETSDAPVGRGAFKSGCQDEHAREWHFGLFNCCSNPMHAFYACCCPRCAAATAVSEYDDSNWCYNCLLKNPCAAQSIVREGPVWGDKKGYNIKGTCLEDMCLPCCCHCCSVARLLNEVRHPECGNIKHHETNTNAKHQSAQA